MNVLKFILAAAVLFFVSVNTFVAQTLSQNQENQINQYKEKLNRAQENQNNSEVASYYGKIAYTYWRAGIYNQAILHFSNSLEYNQKAGNKNGIKTIHYNIGLIHIDQEEYSTALSEFEKGLAIARSLDQKTGVYTGLINIAEVQKNLEKHQQSVENAKEALSIAKELNNLKLVRRCYGVLAENYKALGDNEKSMKYFDEFSVIDKHIKNNQISQIESDSKKKVDEIKGEKAKQEKELKDRTQKLAVTKDSLQETKELTLLQQKQNKLNELALKKQEAQLKNRRLIIYGLSGIALLILIFLVIIFRQFKQKKKANMLLGKQNEQINKQKDEIEKQRDLANKQKKDITDSIEYASRIQNALLPPDYLVEKSLQDYFILFKPRDIVSGDFYWMTQKDNKLILAAADCTGHGVPGAFMSMLGIAFLNEIVNKIVENEHVYSLQANEILNQLRSYIIESLHQSTDNLESRDGIDIALTIIDFNTQKIQFAGAHNPLYLIRNNELIEKKADRMPVAIHQKAEQPFSNHEIEFKDQDIIYIFSDGFHDQIGGKKGRKFMSRKFKKFLLEIHKEPMNKQKKLLDNKFEEWRDGYQQLDDILIIGAKLKTEPKSKVKPKSEYDWQDYSILIAEDTEMNFIFLTEALKHTGVNIIHAKDGKEAVEIIQNNPDINLVLMDINMPRLNGFESTKKIKEINEKIPVIAQTALDIDNAAEKSKEYGCDDYIRKPIKLKSLLSLIDRYLKS